MTDRLDVERLGGFAGFGGGHLKSRGSVVRSTLDHADRDRVDHLFARPASAAGPGPAGADAFRYRITRHTDAGPQSVEVPEHEVPQSLVDSVQDSLD